MVNIFIDANILVDIIQKRQPFYEESDFLLTALKDNNLYISAISVHILMYLTKGADKKSVKEFISKFTIVELTTELLMHSFEVDNKDFEDNIQALSCFQVARILITRNIKDFKKFEDFIDIFTPHEYLKLI